jgi:UDP-3-O-[3-hydroxymyristoyl] glucosamine N-acyltransferase
MALNITSGKLAELVSGKLEGDASLRLTGAATLADAEAGDVAFLGNPKYAAQAASTKAGCVLLPSAGKPAPCSAAVKIFVEDPQFAFSRVLVMIAESKPKKAPSIDPRAAVDASAKLGKGVSVGAFAVIGAGAEIGDGTTISPQVFIGDRAKVGRDCLLHPQTVVREECVLGDRVILQPGCMIGGDGFGFSTDRKTGKHRKIPQVGNVVVEDDVEIGANVTIDRGAVGATRIGAGTKIDNLVQLAHGVKVGRDCLIVSQVGVSGSTTLGDRVILAGQAGLIGHLNIGDGAIVMAQSGVMNDLEKGQIVFGSPCRPNREAMKLQALTGKLPEIHETIKEIKKKLGLGAKAGEGQGA